MLVLVKRNYISDHGAVVGPDEVIDLPKDVAERFLKSGQVVKVESPEIETVIKAEEAKEAAQDVPEPTLPEPDIKAAKRRK